LVISLPGIGWHDVEDARPPHLDALFRRSSIANLSTRAPTLRTDLGAGYATLGAGDKAVGTTSLDGGAALEVGEPFDDGTAREAFRRRTGEVVRSGIVHLGIESIRAANEASLWEAEVGALGDALAAAGFDRAVVANADIDPAEPISSTPLSRWHREAAAGVMGSGGVVPDGRVDDGLLERDPAAPWGLRTSRPAVLDAFDRVWSDRSVVLVEASDLARADMYASVQTEDERDATRAAALARADELVGELLTRTATG
jgi:hypothetical protein